MKTLNEMAREAGLHLATDVNWMPIIGLKYAEKFAELVRADEREACAKLCEELLERPSGYQGTWEGYGNFKTQMTGQECAAAIRARGNT